MSIHVLHAGKTHKFIQNLPPRVGKHLGDGHGTVLRNGC